MGDGLVTAVLQPPGRAPGTAPRWRICEAIARRRARAGRRQRRRRRPARRRARARAAARRRDPRVSVLAQLEPHGGQPRHAWTRCARSAARGARRRWSSSAERTLTDVAARAARSRRWRRRSARGKPLIVVGEPGSGRLSRVRAAAGVLAREGWVTFEAGRGRGQRGDDLRRRARGPDAAPRRDAHRPRRGLDRPGDRGDALRRHLPPEPARRARPAAGGAGRRAHARRRDRRPGRLRAARARASGGARRLRRRSAWRRWTSRARSRSPRARRR